MLETKPQIAGYAPRPAAPRLSGTTVRAVPSRTPPPDPDRRRTDRTADARPRGSRVGRSEARLLTLAVASAVVVCGLLVLHLAAYARLTMLTIDQSRTRHELRDKWQQNQILRAQEAALKNPDRIAARAVRLGLTMSRPHVDYIRPATATGGAPDARGGAGSQGTNSGPKTEDNLTARND